ncbi:LEA_6 domain-containing protein [Cinnamomum micranthum f. kanehirae]|uniref:LEA_6 domain-containing protein n=1 Tax=Cinnamomum micranthum f. kanehirae TaxID=337451 RepID=A0A443PU95_9MAGN|nr:LEA_6 domain-containing protein [Cinnamomum micranthum f. kanehirae]
MSKSGQQKEDMMQNAMTQGKGKEGLESLPLESSPYVNYSDLEDYKSKGYGAQDHLEPVETGKEGGATNAPTPSGSTLTNSHQAMAFDPDNPQHLQDYKRRGYGTQDHLEPVEAGKGGGNTNAPTRSGSELNKSPQAMVFDSANPPLDTGKEGGTIDVLLLLRLWSSNHPYCWCCSSSGQSLSLYLNRMWSYPS